MPKGKTRRHGNPKRHCGVVYIVTCSKSDMVYIGKTVNEYPVSRWKQHIAQADAGDTDKFHTAMREHGADSFEFLPIACVLRREDLSGLELQLIEQYDSEVSGYNTDGPKRWEKQSKELRALNSALFKAVQKIGPDEVIRILRQAAES